MNLDKFLLDILVCPATKKSLQLMDAPTLHKLNVAIDKGKLRDQGGSLVSLRLQSALLREDGVIAYPVWDEMPRLLVEAAIEMDQLR